MQGLVKDIGEWSETTFGVGDRTKPLLEHLKKEVDEAIVTHDIKSIYFDWALADCFILLFDIMYRNNMTMGQIESVIKEKMDVNKKRKWHNPDENGIIEHVR